MTTRRKRSALSASIDSTLEVRPEKSSKRKNRRSNGNAEKLPQNVFTRLISEAGVILDIQGNKLSSDSVTFRRKFCNLVENHNDDITETLEAIDKGLDECFENEKFFICGLMSTDLLTVPSGDDITPSQMANNVQDSVLKMLLHCEQIQSIVVGLLLKKLPLYAENENVKMDTSFGCSGANDIVNVPRLILNQMRWVDIFKDPSSVASQLLELASIMKPGVACDIICFIPDLLADDGEHAAIALGLCDLLNNGPENITSAVFEALSNLVLNESVIKDVYDLAVSYLTTASQDDIPVIIKYLLKSCITVESAKEVINVLHPHLDFSVLLSSSSGLNQETMKSSTSLIADAIFSVMQFHPCIATAWLNVLEKRRGTEINVGDVIALLLLCDVHNSKHRRNAINIMHLKMKRGILPKTKVQQALELCPHIICSHFKSICKLAQGMVWHSEPCLKTAGAFLYQLFLLNLDSYCRQETIGVLVVHISSMSNESNSETDVALDVLCEVARIKPSVLCAYTNFIRDALDRMDLMTLSQVRKSYHVLSLLAFSGTNDAFSLSIRDEIHMMLQKQLTNVLGRIRHIGIIGSVTSLVAMSQVQQCSTSTSQQKKQLSSLLETVNHVLRNDVQGWSLFFDEVYLMFTDSAKYGNTNDNLRKHINDDAQSKLQSRFLTDFTGTDSHELSSTSHLKLLYRYGLLSSEEQKETGVAIQLTPLLINSQNRHVPTLLCSLLRAISSVLSAPTGSLSDIDALLSCPILFHHVSYEEKNEFKQLSADKASIILDSLFALINWFRELVSIFCLEEDSDTEISVLVRWKQICHLQSTTEKLLTLAPSGYAPVCIYSGNLDVTIGNNSLQKVSNKSNANSKTNVLESSLKGKSQNASFNSTGVLSSKSVKTKKEKKPPQTANTPINLLSAVYRPFLRELSQDVFVLLHRPLKILKQQSADLEHNSLNEEKYLKPQHLLVLLMDLNDKLRHRLVVNKLPIGFGHQVNVNIGFERLDSVPVSSVVNKTVKLVPHLLRHLEDINAHFQEVSRLNDSHESHHSMDSEHSEGDLLLQRDYLSNSFGLLIEILAHIVSWHGMDEECNKELLVALLKHLSSRLNNSTQKSDQTLMLSTGFRYILNFSATVPSCHSAHTLIKLLISLFDFADDSKSQQIWMAKKISKTCAECLQRDWHDSATSGNTQKQSLAFSGIFHAHLKYSEDTLESIEDFLKNSLSYLSDKSDENSEDRPTAANRVNYPCVARANFHIFYKCMMESLASQASAIPAPNTNNQSAENIDLLLRWNEIVKVLDILIRVLKTFSSRFMLSPALKYARATVESFLRNGILVCETTFKEHQDDVISLLKKVQMSTRQLQHIACHSKVSKDSSLTNHVPALKRCLETFVFRVKAMMVLHNCHEAFWLGNLKNRNLQGEELLSQVPQARSSSDEDSDDNNVSHEVSANHAETSVADQSYSESY